jgi:Mrp family chromosome partitioning ATPase
VPTRPSSNSRPQLAVLGLLLASGWCRAAIGFEFLDDRIRGPADVEAALGGPRPTPSRSCTGGPLETALLEEPEGPPAAALRALAVRLNRARLRHGARLFAFSGLGEGVGNTALALNTAQALGCLVPRVLLLSLGRTELAARAGLPLRPAGPALLRDPEGLAAAIVADPARGIDLAAIALTGDPLPSKVGLEDLVRTLRARYDAVVLDVGPVPADDLALATLHHLDGVVFTVREDETLFRTLRRALDAATAAGVPALTALLNGTCRPTEGWLSTQIQRALRPVTVLHRRAAATSGRAAAGPGSRRHEDRPGRHRHRRRLSSHLRPVHPRPLRVVRRSGTATTCASSTSPVRDLPGKKFTWQKLCLPDDTVVRRLRPHRRAGQRHPHRPRRARVARGAGRQGGSGAPTNQGHSCRSITTAGC